MLKIVSIETMRKIEAAADANGVTYAQMMENAGKAVAERTFARLLDKNRGRVLVLVGDGNNGGDGLVAARYLAHHDGIRVTCYLLSARPEDDRNFVLAKEAGVVIEVHTSDRASLVEYVREADIILDSLFGIGVRLPIHGEATDILRTVKETIQELKNEFNPVMIPINFLPLNPFTKNIVPQVIAVDCPSGVDCDTGNMDENVIPADETITFITAKPGLLRFPGAGAAGGLSVAGIGVPEDLPEIQQAPLGLVTVRDIQNMLPARHLDSHKGSYGKVMIVAGSVNYTGAPGLAAEGAYRSGAGLVTVGAPGPVISALSARMVEPTWVLLPHDMGVLSEKAVSLVLEHLDGYESLLLGPGWGQEETTQNFLSQLLQEGNIRSSVKSQKRRTIGFQAQSPQDEDTDSSEEQPVTLPPLVIDADGLNLLAQIESWWTLLDHGAVLTPHPGEMSRLTGLSIEAIQQDRWEIPMQKAQEWGVVVVLKGAHTIVANPDGTAVVLPFKTPALATAGTGDILSGLIAGLLAQGLTPSAAAIVGGYIHGLAGVLAERHYGNSRGVVAGDILRLLQYAWTAITETALL